MTIVLLAGQGPSSWVVARALRQHFGDVTVVLEEAEPRGLFLRRRMRRLGLMKVTGQVLFYVYGRWIAERHAARRRRAILAQHDLDDAPLPASEVHRVPSVNAVETVALLRAVAPDVVVVNGTRIISGDVLSSIQAPFVNMHAGITPTYRGGHGGYWALVNRDRENCGVTVHLVDRGIDTGDILYQAVIEPTQKDSFFTYPYLQLAVGLPLLLRAVSDALNDGLRPYRRDDRRSGLWMHPTLFEYLRNGWLSGVW